MSRREESAHHRMASIYEPRSAFTLLELLVVIAIFAVMVGMILPAVQKAREAAARVRCGNNLRQIGLALHQYHDVRDGFPPGHSGTKPPGTFQGMGWQVRILPYIEQERLWLSSEAAFRQTPNFVLNPPHFGLSTIVPSYSCPSDGRTVSVQTFRKIPVSLTDYLGNSGTNQKKFDGLLYQDSRVRLHDISDGAAQTLLVGERPPSPDNRYGWWYAGIGQNNTGTLDMVLGAAEINTALGGLYGRCSSPSSFAPGNAADFCSVFHYWSYHPGGANFLFADGSVHFLSYSASAILPALATRAGGEVVTLPD
jgi:prepilin-type processing-associated H-X9-DG protein/prepilin-type N-terminal cleavage/methylation domain-containing protein